MKFRKNDYKKALFFLLTGIGAQAVDAGTMGPVAFVPSRVVTLSGGPVWENRGETQTLFLTPEIEKTYVANRSSTTLGYGELFAGMQAGFMNSMQYQLGLAVAIAGNAEFSGVIWDDADPQFDNFTYKYKVDHAHVGLKGKILAGDVFSLIPWISGSVALGFNRAFDFDNQPVIFEAVKTPNFISHTETAFTYTLGAGVQKAINQNWQVGIGYEFADWGKSQLGLAAGQTLANVLTEDHLYTNGVLLNVTYLG